MSNINAAMASLNRVQALVGELLRETPQAADVETVLAIGDLLAAAVSATAKSAGEVVTTEDAAVLADLAKLWDDVRKGAITARIR